MAGSVVERLIVLFGAQKIPGSDAAVRWYSTLSLAATTAGAAIAGAAIATAAEIDSQAKLARSLGATTEEYTRLSFALERGGVTAEQQGTLLRSLQMRIAAVGAGSKEAATDFAKVGVRVRNANGDLRTAADLLPDVIRGLEGMPEGDRLSMQLRLLGESGGALATVIGDGADELERMERRADRLGVVIDSETAAASERLTDSVGDLRASLRGVRIQLVSAFIPAVADATDGLTEFVVAEDGIVRAGLDRAVRAAGVALDFMATPAGKAGSALALIGTAVAGVRGAPGIAAALGKVSPAAGAAASGLGSLIAKAGPAALVIAALALVVEDLVVGAQGGDSAILRLAESMGVGEEAAFALTGVGEMLTAAWGAAGAVMTGAKVAVLAIGDAIASVFPSLQPMIDALRELELVSGALGFIGEQFRSAAEGYGELARFAMGDESVVLNTDRGETSASVGRLLASPVSEIGASGAVLLASAARSDAMGTDVDAGLAEAAPGQALADVFSRSAQGYQQAGSALMDTFSRSAQGYQQAAQYAMGRPVTRTADVSVSVTMDTRRAAMDAGREVESQVYAALSEIEAQ